MTVKEENVLMRFKDNAGNETKVYPVTRKENVIGLEKELSRKSNLFVQPNEPTDAADGSVWVDTDDVGVSNIDATLTLSGYAADAKVTGTKIAGVESDLSTLKSNAIGAGSYIYQDVDGGSANDLITDQHKFVYNMSDTAFAYGLLDVRRTDSHTFTPNSQKPIIHQTMREWNTTNMAHRVSTDTGATWSAWSTVGVANLWFNSSHTADFAGQNITFNSDGYRFLVIAFKNYKNSDVQKTITILPNSNRKYDMTALHASGTTFTIANRKLTKTTSGITFENAYISGDSATHNEYCIPWVVYGIGF